MLTEEEILSRLDNYKVGPYCRFIDLGHPYSYLIDSRLSVFTEDGDRWAIVAERLGYNPRAGGILLDIFYFGNCLTNLEVLNGEKINYYTVSPIAWETFTETSSEDVLSPDTKFWTVRGMRVEMSHNKQDYLDAGIELKEYEPDEIRLEEVGRLLITTHHELLRASDEELYKSIPSDLKKILILDEWYHRDINEITNEMLTDEHLLRAYEFNSNLGGSIYPLDYDSFVHSIRQQEQANHDYNRSQWEANRPSSYETWQLLAKVISTGDVSLYRPIMQPNSNWKHWPDSGSL